MQHVVFTRAPQREIPVLRHLPNVLTSLRLVAVPVLAGLAAADRRAAFTALLIFCLAGDVIDGFLARVMKAATPAGALLDSTADTLLLFVAAYGAWVFHPDVLRAHPVGFALVPGLWAAESVTALVRYGRISAYHTYLSRLAANLLGLFIGLLFLVGFIPPLFYGAITLLVISTIEEFALLWLLPAWESDVRGAWWVLRARRAAARTRAGSE